MARKPPDWHQPSLFPTDPDKSPEPEDQSHSKPEGDQHAVQDNSSRTPATTTGDTRATPEGPGVAPDNGAVCQGTEDQPRGLDATTRPAEAGQRPTSDRLGSVGSSRQGTGGSFVRRLLAERQRGAFPRRGNAVSPPSHATRVNA